MPREGRKIPKASPLGSKTWGKVTQPRVEISYRARKTPRPTSPSIIRRQLDHCLSILLVLPMPTMAIAKCKWHVLCSQQHPEWLSWPTRSPEDFDALMLDHVQAEV